jgi:PmbA protein
MIHYCGEEEVPLEKLLEMARRVADQAEVFSIQDEAEGASFENARLKDIESKDQSGISLRIIKDGRAGFAYTKNLLDREEFLQNALDSLKGGVEAPLDFPLTREVPSLDTYDASVESLSSSSLVEECARVCETMVPRTTGQINLSSSRGIVRRRLINSRGTDLSTRSSYYSLNAEILYPGSYSAIHRPLVSKKFERVPESYVHFLLDLYNPSLPEVTVPTGRMKVLFLPETLYALIWRLESATNGRNIYQKVSPLIDRIGEEVFDEKLTIDDDPLDDRLPGARAFDDEGMACRLLSIVKGGVLKSFYYDLFYARKMKASPTGHGYKSAMWGGEAVSFKPSPALAHLCMKPGDKSLDALLRVMDRGVIAAGVMGAHSGNILNGDFSVGLSPGLYVEGGEVRGHLKDAMVAGNIFEVMKKIIAMEDTLHPTYGGTFPAILFDDVTVATKS